MELFTELVKRAKTGDVDAFAEIYEMFYKELYRFALYILKNREDAEDVVSETVLDAYASIGKLRKEESVKAWLFQILTNKCKRRMKEYYFRTVDIAEVENTLSEEKELSGRLFLQKTLENLSAEERMIVGMHVFGGYHTREIAEILKMNHSTVRVKESRAYKKLAKMLGE